MQNFNVNLNQAIARGNIHTVDSIGTTTGAQLLAMLAYDIVTDVYPDNDTRLIGTPADSVKAQNFEFEIS